ncbi:MAG: RtcB family protein [Deltaproteobacteria bacterium]|nr:RtcB family protein [Deltaproteobacteria bacterium]
MRVPGIIYASEEILPAIRSDESLQQVANVAQLPGIVKNSLAMPDIHSGYGFPIGGVAAFDLEGGVISPGGVGYDINCGCRLLATDLKRGDLKDRIEELVLALYQHVPTGVGSKGPLKLSASDEKKLLAEGAQWAVNKGFGISDHLIHTESHGRIEDADPDVISDRALKRGQQQLGTLGSGNHFLEVGLVEEVYDEETARMLGLERDQVTVLIHSGSRGLGHQVCSDFLVRLQEEAQKKKIALPDRQLVYAELGTATARDYQAAMACAANYAWANRQLLMYWTIEVFEQALGLSPREHGMRLVYDVCHNIAKIEEHAIDGKKRKVCVHRKGATRALPPGHPDLPPVFKKTGQPVLIPGDMGTASYVLVGAPGAMEHTFGSTCHGAGRLLSRAAAKKTAKGRAIVRELEDRGIFVRSAGRATLLEEIPEAYKDVDQVVDVVHNAGISRKVARLRPWGVIKG